MAREDDKTTPTIPGIFSTIAAGFDIVTGHLWLVLLPIALDVFYWIGPQLHATSLWLAFADLFREAGTMLEMADQIAGLAGRTNLFTFVSVPFLGIPGLMAGLIMPEQTPVSPPGWEVQHITVWLLLFFAVSLVGLLVSAIFHAFVARAVCHDDPEHCAMKDYSEAAPWLSMLGRLPVYCLRMLGLALLLLLLALAVYVPLALVSAFITLFSPSLGSLVMLGGLVIIIWIVFYMSFALHGILLKERPVLPALLDSVRLVQRNWLSALSLLVLIVGLRNIMAWIWLQVDTGSWFTLVSIIGYAFINTSLIAATFIFYRDRIELIRRGYLHE